MDSRKFGSVVLASVSIADGHLDVFTRVANALNKQNPDRATAMATLLEQALVNFEVAVESPRPQTLAERYEAFSPELKAKLMLENGHLHFTVQGTALNSKDWEARLKTGGHKLSKYSADVLSKPDYNKNHRLEAGKIYKLGLVFGTEIAKDSERTTSNLKAHALREFGPEANEDLKGEVELLIREKFTNAELQAMGLWYIAVLHNPITDSGGHPRVLYSDRFVGSYVRAYYDGPGGQWRARGAFASLAS